MIEAFSLATAHLYQDALASQARLRNDVFVKQRGLDHSSFDELEFDEFDTPSALYLVWRDEERRVRGMARLLRTDRPYMLARYWPFLVNERALPNSCDIWEVTRVCVDRTLTPPVRRTVFPELLSAIAEFFQANGFAGMVGVTRQHLLAHFIREGIDWLGDEALIEGEVERAFFVPTAHIRPVYFCRKYGIPSSVLKEHPPTPFRRAA
ncbi:GNAT family N-acetyltransferase [Bradyrhizobium elkanii]|uniref:GNAT family N-acetyltransferase n=1 Tax=Bradyrhizobium elkanii TaxID=29448 RepID=A0A4U6S097_BRAEL|nr:acyl-homoserine-lactone synthase [Bradyrhizobium elkanii]TKV80103.1 GNAT family N-acetyltransferase [Bradyrhizobium elkanii]